MPRELHIGNGLERGHREKIEVYIRHVSFFYIRGTRSLPYFLHVVSYAFIW
jgi:hypothetical protein